MSKPVYITQDKPLVIHIPKLTNLIDRAIYGNYHNVIVLWGELGTGKSSLGLRLLRRTLKKHDNENWDLCFDHLDFTFYEVYDRIQMAVEKDKRIDIMKWDDLAVYFHRATIQYMHPKVKDFFGKYNLVRDYVANLVISVPDVEFIPRQLLNFMTADLWVTSRGNADFDRVRLMRSFKGRKKSFPKNYDGDDVHWKPVPDHIYKRYRALRHQHAYEAFANPQSSFVNTMPGDR